MANFPKEFTMKLDIENIHETRKKRSEKEIHFNIPWHISFLNDDELQVFIFCAKAETSNLWSIQAECVFVFKSATAEKTLLPFHCILSSAEMIGTATAENFFLDAFKVGETVTISCRVIIRNMVGIPQKRKLDFETPNGKMTDVALKVGEEKFHVSKVLLANFSPVFRVMFFGEFAESEASEIPIDDTDANDFEIFLNFIYSGDADITEGNLEGVLKLADKYETDVVAAKCEKFLMTTNEVDIWNKLRLSEKYSLTGLQTHCLDGLTAHDLKYLYLSVDDMSEKTAKALLKKSITLL